MYYTPPQFAYQTVVAHPAPVPSPRGYHAFTPYGNAATGSGLGYGRFVSPPSASASPAATIIAAPTQSLPTAPVTAQHHELTHPLAAVSALEVAPVAPQQPQIQLQPPGERGRAQQLQARGVGKVFVGSFNVNGDVITHHEASQWLAQASGADLIVLGFQEALQPAEESLPPPCNTRLPPGEYSRAEVDAAREHQLFQAIEEAVGPGYRRIADVAMGETPSGKVTLRNKEAVEWFGFIRLLVYSKPSLADSVHPKSFVVPVGHKQSVVAQSKPYLPNRAPDKGAVAVFLPELDLLLVNCHLFGTNKYGVPEAVFERVRFQQLDQIHAFLPQAGNTILFGDLNFRVEMYDQPDHKLKAGLDWQTVVRALQEGKVRDVFTRYDRLHRYLTAAKPPRCLQHFHDALGHQLHATGVVPRPTFTYHKGNPFPREPAEKRTPSWTDRVLWKGFQPTACQFQSFPQITMSDHEPVATVFTL